MERFNGEYERNLNFLLNGDTTNFDRKIDDALKKVDPDNFCEEEHLNGGDYHAE